MTMKPARGGTAQPKKRSKQMTTQMKVPDYFGGCPQCGRNDGYVNAGKTHVFICREHKTSWTIGPNRLGTAVNGGNEQR
jgi:hypothetical protein